MAELESVLRTTILSRCMPVLGIALLCVLVGIISHIREKHYEEYDKKHVPLGERWDKNRQAELDFHKNSQKNKRHGLYLAVGIIVILFLFWLIPAWGDLVQNRYASVSGEALFGQIESGSSVTVQTDTGTMKLDLPTNWKDLDFPTQDKHGEIWYSQSSKILLAFCECGENAK